MYLNNWLKIKNKNSDFADDKNKKTEKSKETKEIEM